MTTAAAPATITVALLGNPNTGKSTLFNALSGIRQRTGNYPGVTVEKKEGRLSIHDQPFILVDLPGTYSLAPRSPDEMITVDVLLGRLGGVAPPQVVLCIVDASNLERNLYLVSQVLELGRPIVLALNMTDVAADKGIAIDVAELQRRLGVPIVSVQANKKAGLDALREAIFQASSAPAREPISPFPEAFQTEVATLERLAAANVANAPNTAAGAAPLPRYLVERLLLDTSGYLEQAHLQGVAPEFLKEMHAARQRLAAAGLPVPAVEAMSRYRWVGETLRDVMVRPTQRKTTVSDRIDRVLTHKLWGSVVFVLVMTLMFQAVTRVSGVSDLIGDAIGMIAAWVGQRMADGALKSLLVLGVIQGVGGVLTFLPQIFTLFFFIAVLEDGGYMARAAYLMDRLMSRIGLSGKSFIPLLSSFACAIPGIMAARVIENRRDRLVTILVAPLMSCSARIPVYTLLAVTFIPHHEYGYGWLTVSLPGLVMLSMYALGIVAAVMVALLLKRTVLSGATPPFVMELPGYKVPGFRVVLQRMIDSGFSFIRQAGSLIVAMSVLVWAAGYFPRDAQSLPASLLRERTELQARVATLEANAAATAGGAANDGGAASDAEPSPELVALQEQLAAAEAKIEGEHLRHSYLGRAGRWIEPVVRPLGWDWRLGCAAIASFPAREVVVATLGVIYNLGSEVDEESTSLQATLREARWDGTDRPVFTVPVALSLMAFFSLCAQCASTLALIRRETNSWGWPVFTFVYMTGLAYFVAMLMYQIGSRMS